MQIVIDIVDDDYNRINSYPDGKTFYPITARLYKSVKDGTSLPKGHGRIMDVDKVIKKMEEREEQLKDDRSIWETAAVETALDMFGNTIIEADAPKRRKGTPLEENDSGYNCENWIP